MLAVIESVAGRFASAPLVFGHGTDNAWDEAVALVLGVTGLPDDESSLPAVLDAETVARIDRLAARRIGERVPLAYLLGRCHYAGLEFLIEPGIVIPRSPIGQLLETGLAPWLGADPARVLDVCTGSGCIGILAALVFPAARVTLVDVDPRAVDLARRNVALHGLADRVEVVESDLFDALPAPDQPGGQFDLILSNPPYVDETDMASLPAEYRHEPARGLAGGPGGIALVARMLAALPARLAPGGLFVCEVGASAPALLRAFPRLPLVWPDLPEGGEGVFLLYADLPA